MNSHLSMNRNVQASGLIEIIAFIFQKIYIYIKVNIKILYLQKSEGETVNCFSSVQV